MSTERFYSDLPIENTFSAVQKPECHHALPQDWHVVMTELTELPHGPAPLAYKNANVITAATIISILNLAPDLEMPFVFNGDNSLLAIPECLVSKAHQALASVRTSARREFGFGLKTFIVAVSEIRKNGSDVKVARYCVSSDYVQSQFSGAGIAYAQDLLAQSPEDSPVTAWEEAGQRRSADFRGLECRWEDLHTRPDTVSLVVKAIGTDAPEKTYAEVMSAIHAYYGNDDASRPLTAQDLLLARSLAALKAESILRGGPSNLSRLFYRIKTKVKVEIGRVLMATGLKLGRVDWGRYKETVVSNTDYRKVGTDFRQILSGTAEQREKLVRVLEDLYQRKKIAYGIHLSDRLQMTCIVFDYSGRHIHFVDGADGGLALAAREMKERLAKIMTSEFGVYR